VVLILLLQALADAVALSLAGVVAYLVRTRLFFEVDDYLCNPKQYAILLLTAVILWQVLMLARGGLRRSSLLFRLDEMVLHFQTSLVLLVLTMAATFLYHGYDYSRIIVGMTWLLFVFFGSLARQISRGARIALHHRGIGVSRALLWGNGPKRSLFEKRLRESPGLGIQPTPLPPEADLRAAVASAPYDELFVFDEQLTYETLWDLREASRNPAIEIHLIPSLTNFYARNIGGGFFDGALIVSLASPQSRRFTLAAKRCLDVAVAALFLVLLAPLLFAVALLIKLDSRGPVLFRQTRIGRDGDPFTILKFRSMHAEVDAYAVTPTSESDPRITRVGHLLRATSIDELPQLWNVMRGDMSLVGPRPEMPFIVEQYNALERKRLGVRPGITGLWQIYARTLREPIHSHIEYDLFYIENLSLSMDLMIVLDTLPTMVLRTGV